jgi:hypothetical protein
MFKTLAQNPSQVIQPLFIILHGIRNKQSNARNSFSHKLMGSRLPFHVYYQTANQQLRKRTRETKHINTEKAIFQKANKHTMAK